MKERISKENLTLEEIALLERILSKANSKRTKAELTIKNFAEEYLKYAEQNFSNKYYESIKCSFNHLISFMKEKLMTDLTVKDVEDFMIFLRKSAPRGASVYYRNLKAALNKALSWEYITANPFVKVRMVKTMQNKPDFLNESELNKVVESINNNTIKKIVLAAYYTGCRLNEVLSLKVRNINLSERIITIGDDEFTTKSKKQRIVPIGHKLNEIIIEQLQNKSSSDNYVFGKTNTVRFNSDYVSKTFKKAIRDTNLRESLHFHSLRHSFGTILGQKGVPIITVKEMMGHSSITTTQIYSHSTLHDMRRAINNFN